MLLVQKRMCRTCIYKPKMDVDLEKIEKKSQDKWGDFISFQICHHSKNVCCAGFWKRYKNHFTLGRLAQVLGLVKKVQIDIWEKNP